MAPKPSQVAIQLTIIKHADCTPLRGCPQRQRGIPKVHPALSRESLSSGLARECANNLQYHSPSCVSVHPYGQTLHVLGW